MVIEHDFEQRSDEWFSIRTGKITGSKFGDVMSKGRGKAEWGGTALAYLRQVAAEILTGEREEVFQSKAMEWGNAMEDAALMAFMDKSGLAVESCGFFENTELPGCGSSPDGVGEDFTIELKCPTSKTHMLYLLDTEELIKAYRWQVVGEALFTGKDRAFIASYDPRFPEGKQLAIYEYPTEELAEDKEKLKARLLLAVDLVKEWTE